MPAVATPVANDPNPHLYLSNADVTRLRHQAGNPALAAAYTDLETKTKASVGAWLKKYPPTPAPRSTGELIALGKRDTPSSDLGPLQRLTRFIPRRCSDGYCARN